MQSQALDIPCTVRKVRFEKDLFSICEMSTKSNDVPQDARIHFFGADDQNEIRFVALGDGIRTKPGMKVFLSGLWEENKKFGGQVQLRVSDCRDDVGHGKEAIVAYLSSGLIKGIGKKTAGLIYDQFGEDCIRIIQEKPQTLLQIKGIKTAKLKKIVESYEANADYHALARLLMPLGLTPLAIKNIAKELGKGAASVVRQNPYELCNVRGFSFPKADALARSLGTFEQSDFRIAGGIIYTLDTAQNDGHLYLKRENLCNLACSKDILNSTASVSPISPAQVDLVLARMLKDGRVKTIALGDKANQNEQRIYKPNAYEWEMTAAEAICTMLKKGKVRKTEKEWEVVVRKTEETLGFTLDETQRKAAVTALSSPISVITGGPGTGKTSSLLVLVKAYQTEYPDETIALAAPTGRAARRMSEQIGIDASTLHSLMRIRPNGQTDFKQSCPEEDLIDASLLVVDESSMIDAELMANLMYRMTPKTQLLFLGDSDQLPSVGPGNVLRQMLECPAIPHTRLTRIFRQKEDSLIPYNAANIRQGISGLVYSKKDFFLQRAETEEQALEFIKTLMKRSVDIGISNDVQILCPMRKRGATSTASINEALRDIMNPPDPCKDEIEIGGKLFRVGDKVMQTKNIDGAANGDIGFITKIAKHPEVNVDGEDDASEEEAVLSVQFYPDEPEVKYTRDGAVFLVPATAITIHKSQGSEFKKVIIPLFKSMSFFLKRNLLYTSVTRAREQVILVSDEKSIVKAIGTEDTSRRNTALARIVSLELQNQASMAAIQGIDGL